MPIPVVLVVIAALTGAVSAATGMAGGVLLLAAFALLLPAAAVVPMHAAVQLVAGSARVVAFRRHVDWAFVRQFILGVVPGSLLGAGAFVLLVTLDPNWLRLVLGAAIVVSVFVGRPSAPAATTAGPDRATPTVVLGFLCGVVGMLVGSTGPLVSRGLLARGVVKERHVGTKAWVQSISQLCKLPLFGLALSFDYGAQLGLLVGLAIATTLGTLAGRRLLERLPERRFVLIAKVVLVLVGAQLAVRSALALWA
jgi:uncharacterized membrane protein YfcA